jgi:hypothetical protein
MRLSMLSEVQIRTLQKYCSDTLGWLFDVISVPRLTQEQIDAIFEPLYEDTWLAQNRFIRERRSA